MIRGLLFLVVGVFFMSIPLTVGAASVGSMFGQVTHYLSCTIFGSQCIEETNLQEVPQIALNKEVGVERPEPALQVSGVSDKVLESVHLHRDFVMDDKFNIVTMALRKDITSLQERQPILQQTTIEVVPAENLYQQDKIFVETPPLYDDEIADLWRALSHTNRIDSLSNISIISPTVSGGVFNNITLSAASVSDTLTVSGEVVADTLKSVVYDRGGHVCNVKAYGAVGDDSTDDYEAIMAAIGACPEAGVVFFPAGIYRISQSIVLDRPITLRGTYAPRWSYSSTPRSAIKASTPFTGSGLIHVRDKSISGQSEHNNGGKIESISIDGNSFGTDIHGIYFEGLVRDWELEGVDISQTSGNGFRSEQGTGSGYPRGFTIMHLSIYSPASHGFRAIALNDSYLEDVLVVGGALRGFFLTSLGETKISGSRAVFNALEGLYIDGSTQNGGLQFTDFSTDRNDRHGILVAATGTTTISFNGLLTRRDGKNDYGGTDTPYAGVAVIGSSGNEVAPVLISNLIQLPGIDDDGLGEASPSAGVRVEYSEYLSVDGVLWGVDNPVVDNGNNTKLSIKADALLKTGYVTVTSITYQDAEGWTNPSSNAIAYTDGSVGIGTQTPITKLEIHESAADTATRVSISDTSNRTLFLESPRENDLIARVGISGTAADLQMGTRDYASALHIDNATGYVGFGTNEPTKPIHLSSTASPSMRITDTTNDVTVDVRTDDFQGFIGTASNHDLRFMANGSSKAAITTDGEFGLGTTDPSAQLHTTGSVRFQNFGAGTLQTDANGNISVSSDIRLKDVQGLYTKGLEDVLAIKPILYNWKEVTGFDTETLYAGFSAQNIAEVLPEAVGEDSEGFLTLSDRPILAAVVMSIKEIWSTLSGNTSKIDILTERIETLEAQLGIEQEENNTKNVQEETSDQDVNNEENADMVTEEESTEDEEEVEESNENVEMVDQEDVSEASEESEMDPVEEGVIIGDEEVILIESNTINPIDQEEIIEVEVVIIEELIQEEEIEEVNEPNQSETTSQDIID